MADPESGWCDLTCRHLFFEPYRALEVPDYYKSSSEAANRLSPQRDRHPVGGGQRLVLSVTAVDAAGQSRSRFR